MSPTLLRSIALAVLPIGLAVGVVAQDKAKKSSHERLQPYWNQLELTEEQRSQYDRVVREYAPKIDRLEAELEALKEKRRKEWHAILTSSQMKKLESMQASRGKKKADDKDADDEPAVKPKRGTKKPVEESTEETKTTTKKKPKVESSEETKSSKKKTTKKDSS
jgi:hypothetical protein